MTPAELDALIVRLRMRPQTYQFRIGNDWTPRPTLEAECAAALEGFAKMIREPVATAVVDCNGVVVGADLVNELSTMPDLWDESYAEHAPHKEVPLYRKGE
jgi:hypothetical protein